MAINTKSLKWTVGLTTCPRPNADYLEQTITSFAKTGFGNPWIFSEPYTRLPSNCFKQLIIRNKRVGTWTNWATGLFELLLTEPNTDYFLMIQDDVLFCRDIKEFIEDHLSSLGQFGVISLFTPGNLYKPNMNGFYNISLGMRNSSAVAIIMAKEQVISFFSDPDVQNHRFRDVFGKEDNFWQKKTDPRNSLIDAVIGLWAEKNSLPIFYHFPSLTEHVGESSVITDNPATIENGRKSKDFVGQNRSATDFSPAAIRKLPEVSLN